MAIKYAAQNGVWSASSTWTGGVLPAAGDTVYLNNKTVYIDTDIDLQTGAVAVVAGSFVVGCYYRITQLGTDFTLIGASANTIGVRFKALGAGSGTGMALPLGTLTNESLGLPVIAQNGGAYLYDGNTVRFDVASGGSVSSNYTVQYLGWGSATIIGDIYGNATGRAVSHQEGSGLLTITGSLKTTTGQLMASVFITSQSGMFVLNGNIEQSSVTGMTGMLHINTARDVTVNGSVVGTTVSSSYGVYASGSFVGILRIYGNITGGTNTSSYGVLVASKCHVIVGTAQAPVTITGGSGTTAYGLYINSTTASFEIHASQITGGSSTGVGVQTTAPGVVTIYGGTIAGSATASGLVSVTSSPTTINGNIVGGSGANAVGVNHNGFGLVVNGNVTGGSGASAHGLYLQSANDTVTINGNVTGGTGGSAYGVYRLANGTVSVIINGTATPGVNTSSTNYGVYHDSGTLYLTKSVGGPFGAGYNASSNPCGLFVGLKATAAYVKQLQTGPKGAPAVNGNVFMWEDAPNNTVRHDIADGEINTLVHFGGVANRLPAASDVRSGTSYRFGEVFGTLAMPAPGSVDNGVAVDATTGTAALSAAAACGLARDAAASAGGLLERVKDAVTTGILGQQLNTD